MNDRVVKLQVKVYLDGDEGHPLVLTSDIFRTNNVFTTFAVPRVDDWIRDAARRLLEGRTPVRPMTPDPDLMQNISILEGEQSLPEIKVEEPDIDKDVILVENLESIVTADAPIADISVQDVPNNVRKEDDLEITIVSQVMPSDKGKKQLRLIVRPEALEKAREHAKKDTTRETGGVMLGMFLEDESTITVIFTGIVRALSAVRKTSTVKFTPETWAEIWDAIDRDKDYSDENIWRIIGWYHTHPGLGVFLSGYDKFIQKEYFTCKGHLALVIDPIKGDIGFFITDKGTGDTPMLAESAVMIAKNEKDFSKKVKSLRKQSKQQALPPSEIVVLKEDGHG